MEYQVPCSCFRKAKNGRPECIEELPVHFPNVMDQTGTVVIVTQEDDTNTSHRRKRDVERSDDLTKEDFKLFRHSAWSRGSKRQKRASQAQAKFTKQNATRYCLERISDSDVGKLCAKLGANVQALVNSCSIDLEVIFWIFFLNDRYSIHAAMCSFRYPIQTGLFLGGFKDRGGRNPPPSSSVTPKI